MELMLFRHGEAIPVGPEASRDEDRPLTESGRGELRRVGQGLARLDLVPETVLTSPLLRARQSAEALIHGFGPGQGPELSLFEGLKPGATPAQISARLEAERSRTRVALVGHQPDIGRMLSFLVSGGSMELQFAVRPGTVCIVEVDSVPLRAPGRLLLLASPGFFLGLSAAQS